jgi:hypothetical protein
MSRRPLNAEAMKSPFGISGGQSDNETGFSRQYHSTVTSYSLVYHVASRQSERLAPAIPYTHSPRWAIIPTTSY